MNGKVYFSSDYTEFPDPFSTTLLLILCFLRRIPVSTQLIISTGITLGSLISLNVHSI